jgi:hypothetical protein
MVNQSRLKLALAILTLVPLVLAACSPADSLISPTVELTRLPPTKTSTPKERTPAATPELSAQFEAQTISPETLFNDKDAKMTQTPQNPAPQSLTEDQLVAHAKADLAKRLGIPPEQIELLSAEAVVWPDGSLGCPEPGVEHIQIQREGTLIRLRVGKRVYQYHSGGGRPPFLCEHPSVYKDLPPSSGFGNE